jgi:NADP-dependent aldehyde dehydrogenase
MLTQGIASAFEKGVRHLEGSAGVTRVTGASDGIDAAKGHAAAVVFTTDARTFLANPALSEEVFGPETLIVACRDAAEALQVARSLEGQLTATIHGTPDDLADWRPLVRILESKVGRLLFNGFPTGVEVCASMQHGGPYPATTDSRSTSVGTAAILRFARPVCWQDAPQEILPSELQDANPGGVLRLVNNAWTREPLA